MTTIDSSAAIFERLNPAESARKDTTARSVEDMGSGDFLTLMVAQMENQDPTKPMDNMEFMSQLAQFGTVSGVQELNEAFAGLSSTMTGAQALQASSLVGRSVATDSNVGSLTPLGMTEDGETVMGLQASVDMGEQSSGGTFYVKDMAGRLVFSGSLPSGSGSQFVRWDGIDNNGEAVPPGQYRISAETTYGGQSRAAQVSAHERVASVSIGANNNVTLNLANGDSVAVNAVKEFF
jgi:flagellar basal-body rod modification protein FlgD